MTEMAGVPVSLTVPEFHAAVQVGLLRFTTSSLRTMNHATTYQRTWRERLDEEIIGACGERVFCKAFGQHWDSSVDTYHNIPDAPGGVEIRSTWRQDGSLIVRDNDADDRWYYLVTGDPPAMVVQGGIRGRDAKQEQWLRDPHGHRKSWFVPQSALHRPRALAAL